MENRSSLPLFYFWNECQGSGSTELRTNMFAKGWNPRSFLKLPKFSEFTLRITEFYLFFGKNVFEIVIFHHVTLEYWKWVIKSQNSKNRVVQPLLNQNIEMPRLIICQRNQQKYIIGFPLLIWFHLYNLNWRILSSRIDTRHAYTS